MNGILPAPCTAMPQLALSASRSGDSARLRRARVREQAEQRRRDHRGGARDEALRDELRRVTGRGWSGWRQRRRRDGGCAAAAIFSSSLQAPSLQQRAGAAEDRRTGALTTTSVRSAAQLPPQAVSLPISASTSVATSAASAAVVRPVPTARVDQRARDLGALGRRVERGGRRRAEVEAREVRGAHARRRPPARCSTRSRAARRRPGARTGSPRCSRPSAAAACTRVVGRRDVRVRRRHAGHVRHRRD